LPIDLDGFFVFGAFLFYALSIQFTSKLLLSPLEDGFRKHEKITFKPDAVVALGGGANGYAPDSKLSPSSYKRFITGVAVAKKMDLPLIFAGGGAPHIDGITEAGAALESANFLADSFGFARPLTSSLNGGFGLILEDKSQNTVQNAGYTFEIMKKNSILNPKVILVTSAFHMKRAKTIFEKSGFKVLAYAVDFRAKKTETRYVDFIPSFEALTNSYVAIKEYLGILKFFFVDSGR